MSTFANAVVADAARDYLRAIHTWLAEHGDMKWQTAKTRHDLALSQAMLEMLAQPATIAPDHEWQCYINIIIGKSANDEEWAQTSQWWELFVRASGIVCTEYYNHATIIGASQTYLRTLRSTDAQNDKQRHELAVWRAGYEQALTHADGHVNVNSKQITL